MNYKEAMKALEAMGTAQNRKVYTRHGVGRKMFGVSYANLGKLKKAIKTDHALAKKLWSSKNHDARILATMVADPSMIKSSDLDAWAKDLDNYIVADAFSSLVAKTEYARNKMKKWIRSRGEWTGAAGWNLVATMAMQVEELSDGVFDQYLDTIQSRIHGSKNRVRHAMIMALIAIGMRNGKLEKKALAVNHRIGFVDVDHGDTGCRTPDPDNYIKRAKARRKKQKKK